MKEAIRRVIFRPYRKGCGPSFTLTLFDIGDREYIGYRLTQTGQRIPIFEGKEFRPSPIDAWDSDETVKALMGFLTLRPGDTDREYFADYTPAQLEYCEQHAEYLSAEVYSRFGE